MGEPLAKICMLADSHDLQDDRIYWKEALSLHNAGFEVHLVMAGNTDATGITAEGIPYRLIKRDRFPGSPLLNYFSKRLPGGLYHRMYQQAAELRADVFHIHDLKLNRIGKRLKNLSYQPGLVYDVHEPYPENILDYWSGSGIRALFRKPWAAWTRSWERKVSSSCDLIITTEENLQRRFKNYFPDKQVEVIYNYTDLPEFNPRETKGQKEFDAIYTGGITRWRGAWKILEAVKLARTDKKDIRVLFLGSWFPPGLREEMSAYIRSHKLEENVIMKESVPYREVAEYYQKSRVGLGIFLPIRTHMIILQIKIFEYMNFGLPILGSNFGHISRIIQEYDCGITVDPEDPKDIADKLIELLKDEAAYTRMSDHGAGAASTYFRWNRMEKKLIQLYKELTGLQ